MSFFGLPFAFLQPWVLAGLLFLPALWFLLRITPPAPKRVIFAPYRFLADLIETDKTTSKTPWPLLLLRMLILALIITALAKPVLNPNETLPSNGPIRLIIDNSWPAAQTWNFQTSEAMRLITMAGAERREITIIGTANEPGQDKPAFHGPLTSAQAQSILKGMSVHSWPASYEAVASLLGEQNAFQSGHTFWLSHGVREGKSALIVEPAKQGGEFSIVMPQNSQMPLLIKPAPQGTSETEIMISGVRSITSPIQARANALANNGNLLDTQSVTFTPSARSGIINFDLPEAMSRQLSRLQIAGRQGAGAALLLNNITNRPLIGIVNSSADNEDAPLTGEAYFIEKALAPFAVIEQGDAADLLALENLPILIMPNVGNLPPQTLNDLESWVRAGGLLIRFAGPNMTQGQNFLIPVPLRQGGRALDGDLTWDTPQQMAAFRENSPYFGLALPEDGIIVQRQLLAEPISDLDQKSWAVLEDGTPLVTADYLDKGLLVLFHTTATPLWSDLSMSGVFVQMLRRTIEMAGRPRITDFQITGTLDPISILNGQGSLVQAPDYVMPIDAAQSQDTPLSSFHPPGIYGNGIMEITRNIGDQIQSINTHTNLPISTETLNYEKQNQTDLMPQFLSAAFILFLIDWLIMVLLFQGLLTFTRKAKTISALIILCCGALLFTAAPAQAADNQAIKYADNIHLAFIKSGDTALDALTLEGLLKLSESLKKRTSIEPSGVVALNPSEDILAFFPFIYWPIHNNQATLDDKAIRNIQSYLDSGGTILIDTRDRMSQGTRADRDGQNASNLRTVLGGLNIPPLKQIPDDHVLGKSFYLLSDFPGRFQGGTIWVEEQSATGRDGVSAVIIGSHDWAGGWAALNSSSAISNRQAEMAHRFGVNLLMYALTGNYKADQVHIPHILQRLGQ
jgi:hypothetical protein